MVKEVDIKSITYEYVNSLSSNKYNAQTKAISNYFSINKHKKLDVLENSVKDFCKNYNSYIAKDFLYKNDYFTPREMYLIHPLYYLYYTYIVFLLANNYYNSSKIDFSKNNMTIFYSGYLDFSFTKDEIKNNAQYFRSYKLFQKAREKFSGYPAIKIDIKDFFNSIKVEVLIKKIRRIMHNSEHIVDDLKYFFDCCNFYYLPQLHYSIASSILSQFYLFDFDHKIQNMLEKENMHLLRYVDDMYFIDLTGKSDRKKYNKILNYISYHLWEDSLVLNTSKTNILNAEEYEKLIEMSEDTYGSDQITRFSSGKFIENKADEVVKNGNLITLILKLCEIEKKDGVDLNKYHNLVDQYISINGGEVKKILNSIIYSSKWRVLSIDNLKKIICNWRYILFNPSQFTVLYILVYRYLEKRKVINDGGKKIKEILNYLFTSDVFTIRETLVAVSYLFQSNFKHRDLMALIEKVNPNYATFIDTFVDT